MSFLKGITGFFVFIPTMIFAIDLGTQTQTCKLGGEPIDLKNKEQIINKSGKIICTSDSGKVLNEVIISSGVLKKHTAISDNGDRKIIEFDEEGKKHGLLKIVSSEGKLIREETFDHGRQDGPIRSFFASGKIKEAYYNVNGQPTTQIEYDENGKLILLKCSEKSVVAEDRMLCGYTGKPSQVQIYNNGKVSERASYFKGQIKKREKYFADGKLAREESIDGKKLAIKTYFPNGKLQTQYSTIEDAFDGKEIEFYDSGAKSRESRWAKGQELERTMFYMNGRPKKRMKFELKNGGSTVFVEDYFDKGNIQARGEFKLKNPGVKWEMLGSQSADVTPLGWHKFFRENGKMDNEVLYNDKGQITQKKEYDKMGKLAKDEQFNSDGRGSK